jgi:hypothetical protein
MAFHVEISATALRHARAFNLGESELRSEIVQPWMTNQMIELGDREWLPEESKLTVLEGRRLEGPDLGMGQGWSNALRTAEDVTRRVLEEAEREAPPPPVAVAVAGETVEEAIAGLREGSEPRPLDLAAAQAAIDRRDPEVAAVIVVTRPRPEPGSSRS